MGVGGGQGDLYLLRQGKPEHFLKLRPKVLTREKESPDTGEREELILQVAQRALRLALRMQVGITRQALVTKGAEQTDGDERRLFIRREWELKVLKCQSLHLSEGSV